MNKKSRLLLSIAVVLIICMTIPLSASAVRYVNAGTNGDTAASDTYKDSKYYTYLTDIKLTGDAPTDILAVALSQLGYTESDSVDDLSGLTGGSGDFTEYNLNFGDFSAGYGYYWCASFVSFCLLQSGCHSYTTLKDWCREHSGDTNYIWRELSCEKWRTALCDASHFNTSYFYRQTPKKDLNKYYNEKYTPTAGDLIFFTEDGKSASHIGFVLYTDGDNVCTIEGNTNEKKSSDGDGNGVYIKTHELKSSYIMGYGDMPYSEDSSVRRIDYKGEHLTVGTYMSRRALPLFDNAKNAKSENSGGRIGTVPQYTMMNVLGIGEHGTLRVSYAADGKMYTGHIPSGDGTIQISSEILKLSIPNNGSNSPSETEASSEDCTEPQDTAESPSRGCSSTTAAALSLITLTALLVSLIITKQKKRA